LKSNHKALIKKLDKTWSLIIKLRAGNKSELSEKTENLDSHHIVRKPCYFLRYDLDNGICLTSYEHRYGIHGSHEEEYREHIKAVRGKDIYEKLMLRKNNTCDLKLIEILLDNEQKKYKNKESL
jgi:hypothetical protein